MQDAQARHSSATPSWWRSTNFARPAAVLLAALLGSTVAWGAAAGGQGLLVVADEEQLRVSAMCGPPPDGPGRDGSRRALRLLASRRTGVPIESVSICRWHGRPHVVLVVGGPDGSVVRTYRLQDAALERAFADLRIQHPAFKAEVADVDGDGIAELLVSVSKRTRYDPAVRLRPFVYEWSGVSWVPKWLGSRLGYDLVHFTCIHQADRDGLLTLERKPNGEKVVTRYRWIGFGFRGTAEPAPSFGRRIGAAANATWVWDRQGHVALQTDDSSGQRAWKRTEVPGPLQAVFRHDGCLCGFDGQGVKPIDMGGVRGGS